MNSLQYNWKYRIYKNGNKLSTFFDDLVPDKVRIAISKDMHYPHTGMNTPFTRIKLVPYSDHPDLKEFNASLIPAKAKDFYIWSELKKAIIEGWLPNKIHVIGSSSGYDSRILAKAIQEIRKEKGDSWYGNTHFVELGGEGDNFVKIMNVLGITDYRVVEPRYDFDYFRDIHKRFNGLCAYPVNQWYDYFVSEWNEEDIQYISGYGGNVSDVMRVSSPFLVRKKRGVKLQVLLSRYFSWNYDYQLSAFRQPKYSFHPFWSWRYIRAVAGFDHKEPKTSMYLCKHFVPECSHIKRLRILYEVTQRGYRTAQQINQMYEWFKSTRYGKTSLIKPSNKIEYNRWWLEYCIASYVETNNINLC